MTGQENKRPNELIEHAPVTLRRFRAEDVDALFRAVTESLDELRPWMPWAADYSRVSAEEYLAGSVKDWDEGTAYNYAIVTRDALVGSIGLMTRCGDRGRGRAGVRPARRGLGGDRARRAERGQRPDPAQARLHRGWAPPAGRALAVRHGHRCGLAPHQVTYAAMGY